MTIISSGQLALQNAGTNPSETVDDKLLDTTMTTGLDSLLTIRQRNEVGDGNYSNVLMWQGDLYGFNNSASNFSSSYIHGRWPMNTSIGITGELRGYSSQSAFGSLGSNTYSDKSSVSRTVKFLLWGLPDASPSPNTNTRIFGFALAGSSVSNTDNTFEKIKITTNGGTAVTIDRDDLSYDSNEAGNSWWEWHGTSGTVYNAITSLGTPSSGTSYDVEIISGTTTTTSNNGIAEEMGGADSSDVRLSDYYRNGDLIGNVTGIPEEGSPPAEIKFSDFYGKTFQGLIINHSTTILPDYYATGGGYVTNYFSGYMEGETAATGVSDTLGNASFPDTGTITFGGLTRNANDVKITEARFFSVNSGASSQQFRLVFEDHSSDHGTSWANSGWTSVEIYLNQSDTSGSPDLTLARTAATSATFFDGTSYTSMTYSWTTSQSYSNYFGNNTTPSSNNTSTINITGLS